MENEIDILEEVYNIKANSKVLITSFKYNQYFFEKHIFTHFKDKSFPLILIDYNEYQNNILDSIKSKYAETKYFIEPIKLTGTFHPKLFFSISEEEAVFLIGSNNLTPAGYSTNLESIIPVSINFNDNDERYLLFDISKVLLDLKEIILSEPHKKEIDKILKCFPTIEDSKNRDSWILSNIKSDLISQIKNIIKNDIIAIKALCPYFSEERKFYENIISSFKELEIFVQNKTNNLPKDELGGLNIKYNEVKISNNRFLHSKIILFKTKDSEYIFTGSANFSMMALSFPSSRGNVEIGVLSKLEHGTFGKLIGEVGSINETTLDKIQSNKPEEEPSKSTGAEKYRILEAVIKGNRVIIKIDQDADKEDVKVFLEGMDKEYKTKVNGNVITLEISEEDKSLFGKTAVIKLNINGKDSDYKILHNPSLFPEQYSMLNSLVSEDADWLFTLLNKLSKMPNFSEYIPLLDKLNDYGLFDGEMNREQLLLKLRNKLAALKPYSHKEKLKEVIQRFISRHEKRISNAIKNHEYKSAKQVLNSFFMINKLILWSVKKDYEDISGLKHIKGNLEDFCGKDEKGYLQIMIENDLNELLKESTFFYHNILLLFIIDLLQNQSNDFRKNYIDRLHYSPLKRAFETSTIFCLNEIHSIIDEKIDLAILKEVKEEYEFLVPELKELMAEDILKRINKLIEEVNLYDYKKYKKIILSS